MVFEVKAAEPIGSAYQVNFVQCAACGAVAGVTDPWSLIGYFQKQNEALKKIARAVNVHVDL